MRKRDSRRRWKARYLLGRFVPVKALVEHDLETWADRLGHQVYWDPYRDEVHRVREVRRL